MKANKIEDAGLAVTKTLETKKKIGQMEKGLKSCALLRKIDR